MPDISRFSFSIEEPLLDRFEKMFKESKYGNRSEFVRDMIRNELVARECDGSHEVLGTIPLSTIIIRVG